jgi:ketosteroid isomerase-like protein
MPASREPDSILPTLYIAGRLDRGQHRDQGCAYVVLRGRGHQHGPKETGMTTQENKQLAINGYQMFLKGDIQGVLDMCAEDVEWTSADLPSVPFAGAFHGRSGVTDFFQKLGDAVEFLDYQPQTFIADDDKVAVSGVSTVRVRATGATYDDIWVHIFTMKNGKTVRFEQFHNTAAAIAAFMPVGASAPMPGLMPAHH